MAAPAATRAYIHEVFFSYSPAIPDQYLDIVSQALDAAVDAIWDWMSNNMVSLNNGLPEPFKSRATTDQKFLLLTIMASTRTGGLFVVPPFEEEEQV